jgi:hypothetical protein
LRRYGLNHGLPRTVEGARSALAKYEADNSDLEFNTRRLLALAAAGSYFGRRLLEEATGSKLPKAVFRDTSWRYWNCLALSGLGSYWNRFREIATTHSISAACSYLKRRVSRKKYEVFSKRVGTISKTNKRKHVGEEVWTKGGTWETRSALTQLLVLKRHLPPREFRTQTQKKLGHQGVRLLEKELMNLIDPDRELIQECKYRAKDYADRRIPEILGWAKIKRAGPSMLAWFFQVRIVSYNEVYKPVAGGYVRRIRQRGFGWEW